MNYPDWAPESLINLYKLRMDNISKGKRHKSLDPEEEIARLRNDERYKSYTDKQFEQLIESLYRGLMAFPMQESDEILLKLISDIRMKEVWSSIDRRKKTDRDAIRFWMACEGAVSGWRGEPKITQKEKLQILTNIQESIANLSNNMGKLKEFHFYSINDLVKNDSIEDLLETLDADLSQFEDNEKVPYTRFRLSEVTPNFHFVLADIHLKAEEYMQEGVTVKKPNSENAPIHYFVRSLSSFFQDYFGQPLHESVAITTSVVLGIEELDSDYVRKLVNN